MNPTNPENTPPGAHAENAAADQANLPRPIVKKMRWPFPIIWIVPLAAAIAAGYYINQHHKERGKEITIEFDDAAGLQANQTGVQIKGVLVGKVETVELSDDHEHAVAHIRLNTKDEFLAKQNSQFWMVRPELSLESVSGLGTLISGPYIEARPGDGEDETHFQGTLKAPIVNQPGAKFCLHADRLGSVQVESPVLFRGIPVGVVQDIRLSDSAEAANVTIYIYEGYLPLVRVNSEFWIEKGVDIRGGIFGGLKLKLDSVRSILTGGIAFADPEKVVGKQATEMQNFFLNESPKDEWLKWRPRIHINPAGAPQTTTPDASAKTDPAASPTQQKSN